MATLPERQADGRRRQAPSRGEAPKRAKIIFDNGASAFDCLVRTVSSTGALLTVDQAAHLPDAFDVVFGGEDIERPARMV